MINDAQHVLSAVQLRHQAGHSWTLHPTEMAALAWLIDLHAVVHAAVDEHQVAASARGIAVSVDAGKPGRIVIA